MYWTVHISRYENGRSVELAFFFHETLRKAYLTTTPAIKPKLMADFETKIS